MLQASSKVFFLTIQLCKLIVRGGWKTSVLNESVLMLKFCGCVCYGFIVIVYFCFKILLLLRLEVLIHVWNLANLQLMIVKTAVFIELWLHLSLVVCSISTLRMDGLCFKALLF